MKVKLVSQLGFEDYFPAEAPKIVSKLKPQHFNNNYTTSERIALGLGKDVDKPKF